MTLKEELEILRGEPIKVFTGDPMSIPCIETSDPEKLCKHPVVSVSMITYNHEPYIRQAIEGVMMQKTDFEFELIIGEDCSQDKTREICFEYQKKYPDKIRVLWWHENVSKLGGNGRRCAARRRGEFVSLCEGDDYWIDPLKLQKQVDVMRKFPDVGLCFCGAKRFYEQSGEWCDWKSGAFTPGLISGKKFLLYHLYGADPTRKPGSEGFIMTASTMFRVSFWRKARNEFDIFTWRLFLGDKQLFFGLSSVSDVYFLPDKTVVYRTNSGGIMTVRRNQVLRDSALVRMYFSVKACGLKPKEIPASVYIAYIQNLMPTLFAWTPRNLVHWVGDLSKTSFGSAFNRWPFFLLKIAVVLIAVTKYVCIRCFGALRPNGRHWVSKRLAQKYKEI